MRVLCAFISLFVVYIAAREVAESVTFTLTQESVDHFVKCANESGYTTADLEDTEKFFEGNAESRFKCFEACLYKRDDVINNNQVDIDKLVKHHHAETLVYFKKEVVECGQKSKGNDECELAYNIEKCLYDNHKNS